MGEFFAGLLVAAFAVFLYVKIKAPRNAKSGGGGSPEGPPSNTDAQ